MKAVIDVTRCDSSASYYGIFVGLSSSNTSDEYTAMSTSTAKHATTGGKVTVSVNLSSYQGSYYIAASASAANANIYEVWFE